jgi:signal transduction histidine kinase
LEGIHPDDRDTVARSIRRSVETGAPYETEYRIIGGNTPRRVVARGSLQQTATGVQRFLGAIIDISYEKETEDALREQTRALEILNETGTSVAAELDLDHVVQTVTDAGVALTKAEFGAFFYNVVNEAGESYMLYALSGVPREAFSRFPMPRNTEVFAPTFSGEAVVRSDDITKDPRYGRNAPRKGMPEGHLPVRSHLAVPVKSRSGEVLGGLFFGHSKPAQFDQDAETMMTGLAAQAAIAIDNARLFQAAQREIGQRRAAEQQLQLLNTGLEERVASEVAQRLQAEDALRQAQKMEAVGQLTGGIAHDFNNLLTIIIGGLDTIRRSGPQDDARLRMAVDMATQGARRAATLTSRLLAFSRRQPLQPKPLDLNVVVRDSTELLHRTLGETIELEGVLAPRLWIVEADQNQLENAILNLAVNARDAMPEGGKLTIETANTMLDESYTATDAEVVPGQYVAVSISDNGIGMSKEVIERAFEPFYTTKDVGRGTGLGLSMVYGFVKQSGGHVTIYSEEGQGTSVKLYFPRYRGATAEANDASEAGPPEGLKGETILVVEDNDDVRSYSRMVLAELGYTVLEAVDAKAAVAIVNQPGRIDLLFTDVVLPGKTGRVLADEALAIRPDLKVLFTTGYSRNAIVHQGRLDVGVQLISKPFTFEELAVRIRKLLDS